MSDRSGTGAITLDGVGAAGPGRTYLIVREGDASRVVELLEGIEVVLGRGPAATVRLVDGMASRQHARIGRRDGGLRLTDLGSRNGTLVNTDLIRGQARALRAGDVVRIGAAEILVAESGAPRLDDLPERRRPPPRSRPVIADEAMLRLFERVRKVAATPTTVLILGETGTGKEVVAEELHRLSARAQGPLLRLNCSSLPATLLESELFGYERGAFTGAEQRKLGYLETAAGGTLLLDEIGELALPLQAKLLRVTEDRRFHRVGGREEIAVDVRILAATNRDLLAEARAGRFREDLYFRLSAFVVEVPPLRARPSEVILLADLFARQFAERMGRPAPILTAAAAASLSAYRWPGNVRELRNAVEQAVILAEADAIDLEHLPERVAQAAPQRGGAMREQVAEVEREAIEGALSAEGGNQTRAAKRLGISRRALLYKLEKYDLKRR